jgi:hypothetical protein
MFKIYYGTVYVNIFPGVPENQGALGKVSAGSVQGDNTNVEFEMGMGSVIFEA